MTIIRYYKDVTIFCDLHRKFYKILAPTKNLDNFISDYSNRLNSGDFILTRTDVTVYSDKILITSHNPDCKHITVNYWTRDDTEYHRDVHGDGWNDHELLKRSFFDWTLVDKLTTLSWRTNVKSVVGKERIYNYSNFVSEVSANGVEDILTETY